MVRAVNAFERIAGSGGISSWTRRVTRVFTADPERADTDAADGVSFIPALGWTGRGCLAWWFARRLHDIEQRKYKPGAGRISRHSRGGPPSALSEPDRSARQQAR